jgi:hypothetical protein
MFYLTAHNTGTTESGTRYEWMAQVNYHLIGAGKVDAFPRTDDNAMLLLLYVAREWLAQRGMALEWTIEPFPVT